MLASMSPGPCSGQANDRAALRIGDSLPVVAGRTLTDEAKVLPLGERASVVMFGFSRAAGEDSRRWGETLGRAGIPVYTVIELEAVPSPLRAMVRSSIRKSIPDIERERSIVVTKDEALWRTRLGVRDTNRAYVLLIDSHAHITWESVQAFRAEDAETVARLAQGLR